MTKIILYLTLLSLVPLIGNCSSTPLNNEPQVSDNQTAENILQDAPWSNQREEEVKVAVIGDTEAGVNFGAVLKMIAAEKADVVVINGDLGYNSSPDSWKNRVTSSISIEALPVIGALGNHDMGNTTNSYISIFQGFRNEKNNLKTKCTGQPEVKQGKEITAVDEVCTFGNVTIVLNAIGQILNKSYLENQLEAKLKAAPANNWKLVGYHFTLDSMNPGLKGDEATHRFFDIIRQYGAIGSQAHTHTVMASCPISSPFKKNSPVSCDPRFTQLEARFLAPGTSVFVDSSLGGKEVRKRNRCRNPNDNGCKHMVDLITQEGYTRTDGVKKNDFNPMGALFFKFNSGGDPTKALAYYKSIDGQVVFSFALVR